MRHTQKYGENVFYIQKKTVSILTIPHVYLDFAPSCQKKSEIGEPPLQNKFVRPLKKEKKLSSFFLFSPQPKLFIPQEENKFWEKLQGNGDTMRMGWNIQCLPPRDFF